MTAAQIEQEIEEMGPLPATKENCERFLELHQELERTIVREGIARFEKCHLQMML